MITHIRLHAREATTPVVAHWQTYAVSFPELTTEIADLDVGDYDLGSVRVERKSATDFNLAIMDRRLFGEVAKLRSSCDQVIYIVEGDMFGARFHSDPQRTREAIAWMTAIQGVALLPSFNEAYTAEILYTMAQAAQHGFSQLPALRNGKPFDPRGAQAYLVEGLPGVNATLAESLLKKFGSAATVFSATAEDLAQTPGMGAALAARVRKTLDAPYAQGRA